MRVIRRRLLLSARLGAGLFAIVGLVGLGASTSAAKVRHATHVNKPVVLDGHICTKTATSRHPRVVGHASNGKPAVLCGVSGNDTLKATGPGVVFLIAGHGNDTLIASNDPAAQDVLVGGSGQDTFVAGNQGDDVIETAPGDTIQCTTGATTTIAGDDQGDNENGNCGGDNVDNATQEWQGTITALTDTTSMTVQWSDNNDAAQAWLDANGDPATVTFNISSATITGTLAVNGQVQVESNPSSSTLAGSTLNAVSVEAQQSDSPSCPGTLTGSVEGDLVVTSGSCTLNGADVQGNVTVGPGATIVVLNATVEGDFASSGASSVSITGSDLQGDVTIEGTTGAVTFNNNTIEGDLTCDANTSTPTGAGNSVQGDASGQCAGLGSGSGGDNSD
jgi:hypothetical protein